jgi:N-acetyl-anhydromuramyl-L-alanine amidase AmpD
VVARDGGIDQYVLEHDTAFHAGLVVLPTWPRLRPKVNPNFYTIGIELEGARDDSWPAAQIQAAATLIADIARRWHIPVDADHVVTHRAIRASTDCPPDSCPVGDIITAAQDRTPILHVPVRTLVRTAARTNLRFGSPSLQGPIIRVIPAGTDVVVPAFTDGGERVQGNVFWYQEEDGGFLWAGSTDVPSPTDATTSAIHPSVSGTTDGMELPESPTPSPPPVGIAAAIDRTTLALPAKGVLDKDTRKDLIVLHFTAGRSARSAFDAWRSDPRRIATSYIVDVDGTIYEVFAPDSWAAHLGVKGTNAHDRRSIGIEIANAGPLQPSSEDPSILNWWPPKAKGASEFTTRFCSLADTDKYVVASYRGKHHFASFRDAQVDATGVLVRELCRQFSIPAALPPISRRFECDVTAFAAYKGVCTHANFRQDKWDIGPAFPWDRLAL